MNSLEFYISLMSGKINVKQRCIEFKQAIYFRHFVKGIKNAIFKLSKRKDCQILLRWQKSVTNTVWYALAKYKGKFEYKGWNILTYQTHNVLEQTFHSFILCRRFRDSKAGYYIHSSPCVQQSRVSQSPSIQQVWSRSY